MTSIVELNKFTNEQIIDQGYDIYFNFGDCFTAIQLMTYNKGRIIYAESLGGIDNAWCYTHYSAAVIALTEWTPSQQREPVGWFKNPITGAKQPQFK